jgi:hypothetical protein
MILFRSNGDRMHAHISTAADSPDVDVDRDDLVVTLSRIAGSFSKTPPDVAQAPIEMTHLGSGIWS